MVIKMQQKTFSKPVSKSEDLDYEINKFGESNNIKATQTHISNGWIYETVYFEQKDQPQARNEVVGVLWISNHQVSIKMNDNEEYVKIPIENFKKQIHDNKTSKIVKLDGIYYKLNKLEKITEKTPSFELQVI